MVKKTKASILACSLSCSGVTAPPARGSLEVAYFSSSDRPLLATLCDFLAAGDDDDVGTDADGDAGDWNRRLAAACGADAASEASSRSDCGIMGGAGGHAAGQLVTGEGALDRRARAGRRVVLWRLVVTRVASGLADAQGADRARQTRDAYSFAALSLLWFLRLPRLNLASAAAHETVQRLVAIAGDDATRAGLTALGANQHSATAGASQVVDAHAIIATGHVGFWELLPAALGVVLPATQSIVYRPLHDAQLDALVANIRAGPDRRLIPDKHCFDLLKRTLALPSGSGRQLVGLVSDQHAGPRTPRALVSFLGQPTQLATGAARLHLETRAPLWFAAVLHDTRFYETSDPDAKPFKLILRPISTDRTDADADAADTTQTYASVLEQVVRDHPAQYLWMHNLWREDPRPAIED